MLWSITFHDDVNNRHWTYDKVVHVNVRQGIIAVVSADNFKTIEKTGDFTRCEISIEAEE